MSSSESNQANCQYQEKEKNSRLKKKHDYRAKKKNIVERYSLYKQVDKKKIIRKEKNERMNQFSNESVIK